MAQHTVKMTEPEHDIINSDIDFWVWADKVQLGHLHVSKGGVDWYEGKSWLKRRSLKWEDLRAFFVKHVATTKGKKPKLKR